MSFCYYRIPLDKLITCMHFRRIPSPSGQDTPSLANDSATPLSGEMETLKQELLAEMRKEINKMKNDIIEGNSVGVICIVFITLRM